MEYDEKIKELQVYIPALEKKINDTRNRSLSSRLEQLRDILTKTRKVPMAILLKSEEAIKKIIGENPNANKSAGEIVTNSNDPVIQNNTQAALVNIKIENKISYINQSDDDDDVQIVAYPGSSADNVIVLDSDSSDGEDHKPQTVSKESIQSNDSINPKPIENSANQVSPTSKEIVKVKLEDMPNETSTSTASQANIPGSKDVDVIIFSALVFPSPQDCTADIALDKANNYISENKSEPSIGLSEKSKTGLQAKLDFNKVAESRGILLQIESELKQLTDKPQLPLSIDDIGREDDISDFLRKSTELPSTQDVNDEIAAAHSGSEHMESDKSKDITENFDTQITTSTEQDNEFRKSPQTLLKSLLPFPFPAFSKPLSLFPSNSKDPTEILKRHDLADADFLPDNSVDSSLLTSRIPNIDTSEQSKASDGRDGSLPMSEIKQGSDCSVQVSSAPDTDAPSDNLIASTRLSPKTTCEEASSALDVPESSQGLTGQENFTGTEGNPRLEEIIASLRTNLTSDDAETETITNSPTQKEIPELYVNKIHLSELPCLVEDMLNTSHASPEVEEDEDNINLVIDESIATAANLSDKTENEFDDIINIDSIANISDLPTKLLDSEDSLDIEINQAIAASNANKMNDSNPEKLVMIGSSQEMSSSIAVGTNKSLNAAIDQSIGPNADASDADASDADATDADASNADASVIFETTTTHFQPPTELKALIEKSELFFENAIKSSGSNSAEIDVVRITELETGFHPCDNENSINDKEEESGKPTIEIAVSGTDNSMDLSTESASVSKPSILESKKSKKEATYKTNDASASESQKSIKVSQERSVQTLEEKSDATELGILVTIQTNLPAPIESISNTMKDAESNIQNQNSKLDISVTNPIAKSGEKSIQIKSVKTKNTATNSNSTDSKIPQKTNSKSPNRKGLSEKSAPESISIALKNQNQNEVSSIHPNRVEDSLETLHRRKLELEREIQLSDVSESDCVSLSLSDVSDLEPGELIEKPQMPRPIISLSKIKIESNEDDDLSSAGLYPENLKKLKFTISNSKPFDLREKLNQNKLEHGAKKKKKKHRKRNHGKMKGEYTEEFTTIFNSRTSTIPHCADKENDQYVDENGASDDEENLIQIRYHLQKQKELASAVPLESISRIAAERAKQESHTTLVDWEELFKSDFGEGRKCTIETKKRYRSPNFDENTQFSLEDEQNFRRSNLASTTPIRFTKFPRQSSKSPQRLSRSPTSHVAHYGRHTSISPKRSSQKSPIRLTSRDSRSTIQPLRGERRPSKSPVRFKRSPGRSSGSPKRLSRSPKRSLGSPTTTRRLSRSPIRLPRLKPRSSRSPRRLSRSPKREPKSPRRLSKSPKRELRSPRRFSISPKRQPGSPRRLSRSPKREPRSPRRSFRSPGQYSRSPRRLSRSPRRSSRSPRRSSRSPRRSSRSPRRLSKSPRRSPRVQRRLSRSPRRSPRPLRRSSSSPRRLSVSLRRMSRSRRRSSRSPRRSSRSPRRLSRSPRRLSRSPRRLSRSPRRLSRSPRRLSRSPRRLSRSPRRAFRSPRRLSRSPRRPSKSPRRSFRSPRRLSRSPRRLSRSPRRSSRSPRRSSRSPRRSSRSPRRSSRSPRRSSRSPRNSSRSVEWNSKMPERSYKSPTRLLHSMSRRLSQSFSGQAAESKKLDQNMGNPNLKMIDASYNKQLSVGENIPPKIDKTKNNNHDQHFETLQTTGLQESVCEVINVSDSEEEEEITVGMGTSTKEVELTIEVSDEEMFLEAPPPPMITASDIKLSPKSEPNVTTSVSLHSSPLQTEVENMSLGTSVVAKHEPKFDLERSDDVCIDMDISNDSSLAEDQAAVTNVEDLKEKNLRELHEIKVKLEREMGISEDVLTQLIGTAVDKFNGAPSASSTAFINDTISEFPTQEEQPTMVMLPSQFYQQPFGKIGHSVMAQVSAKDPRLNRVRPIHSVAAAPALADAPPPPLIPRLTPAVALPPSSPPPRSIASSAEYSDEDDLFSQSESDGSSSTSKKSKEKKSFVMVELTKLEEIIGKQIQKFLAANKEQQIELITSPPKPGNKKKNPKPVAGTSKTISKSTKPMKNARSKDGSGPLHMTAEEIVSDIRKSVASLCNTSAQIPDRQQKTLSTQKKKKHRTSMLGTSSESETETIRSTKPTTVKPSSLRGRITNDVAGIIKLGKAPKSAKVKPTPALKLAEIMADVNLLTPLREIPYEEKRNKKPESGHGKKQKRVPKNIDVSMHCNSGANNCLLCKDKEKEEDLISHYVNVHRENEVFIARFEPGQVATLKETPNYVTPSRKSSNIEKFTGKCPFCNEESTCTIGRFMEHFASHTGEFAYECDCCGIRDSRKRDLLNHCNSECDKGAKSVYVYRYDLSNKLIEACLCVHCNYVQLNTANVVKHIRTEHDKQLITTEDYAMVTLFAVRDGGNADAAPQVDDNIEVNNEAIAEENDDYDYYDDDFCDEPMDNAAANESVNVGNTIEYVKDELLMDAIEDIDWKSIEDTLAESNEGSESRESLQRDTPTEQELLVVEKREEPTQKTEKDVRLLRETETRSLQAPKPMQPTVTIPMSSIKGVNTGSIGSPKSMDSFVPILKDEQYELSNIVEVLLKEEPTSSGPTTKKNPKKVTTSCSNVSSVQNIGFEKIDQRRMKYYCLIADCEFISTESLEELRKHMKGHDQKWSGRCKVCKKKPIKKTYSIDREIVHLINEHLPKKSFVAKILRPWLANETSNSQKTKDVCKMLIKDFHLENLYKCMGPNCVFTTNSSKDMQFHITLNHSEDITALFCCYCEEGFIHSNGVVDHIAKVHGASRYQCNCCFYRSCAAYNVQMHQRTFHVDQQQDAKIIVCPGQSHTFSTEILEILDNRSRNVKSRKCPYCSSLFFVNHLLNDHIQSDHPTKAVDATPSALYNCMYCNFATTDLLTIRQHMANDHPNRLLYVCGRAFIKSLHPSASQTNFHAASIKTTSLVYIGDTVNKKKFQIKDLSSHVFDENSIEAVNSGQDATALNVRIRQMFGEAALHSSEIETYMRKVAEGVMQPDTIKTENTSELDQLVSAAIANTGFVGKDLYRCGVPNCGEAFDNFEQFDRHLTNHKSRKGGMQYSCVHCNEEIAFNQVRIHTVSHRRHRYLCFFCAESSPSQGLAIGHLKSAHKSESNVFVYLTTDKDWSAFAEVESRIFVAMPRKNDRGVDVTETMLSILKKQNTTEEREIPTEIASERPESPVDRKEETIIPVFVSSDARLCCNIDNCPFVAKTDDDLMQHFRERHLIVVSGLYSCAHCPYNMGSAQLNISRITRHLQFHGPTIVVCDVCNYYHYNRLRVLNHISVCHPYNFVTMTLHARSSKGIKTKTEILYNSSVRSPEDSYKCTLCSATLTECEDFFIHMRELHQLNVRFKCDMCPFFDNSQQMVEAHARKTHTGENKIRIRSIFLPGGKWVQNLSPFELLIESSDQAEEGGSDSVTGVTAKISIAPENVALLESGNKSPKKETSRNPSPLTAESGGSNHSENSQKRKLDESGNKSPKKETSRNASPLTTESGGSNHSENSQKRKLDEPQNASYKPESKKSRSSGAKRTSSSTKATETIQKRSKISSPTNEAVEVASSTSRKSPEITSMKKGTSTQVEPEQEENRKPRLKLVPVEKLLQRNFSGVEPPTVQQEQVQEHIPAVVVPSTSTDLNPIVGNVFLPPSDIFLICVHCNLKSECFTKLRSHFRADHPNDSVHFYVAKKLLCVYCNTTAPFNEMKAHHLETHSKDFFLTREAENHKKCAECLFEYSNIVQLKEHCNREHSSLYYQKYPSFAYLNQEYLEQLLKIGVNQNAEVFKCPSCNHMYLKEADCRNHIAKAHAPTPDSNFVRTSPNKLVYGCVQCKVFFETMLRAILHIRKHTDPYGCNKCEMRFGRHELLSDHYQLYHKSNDQSYMLGNPLEANQKFMEMLLRFPNGLVLTKLQAEHTVYGQHEQFTHTIESMEKAELQKWICKQARTEQIDSIARIKMEIEQEASLFTRSLTDTFQ